MFLKRLHLGFLALAVMAPAAAQAQATEGSEFHATTLNLSAQGQVQATPDLAVIRIGVQTDAQTAAAALARNRDQMTAAVAALKGQGVADKDIQTSDLSLDPQYVDDGKAPRRLDGYHAANTVTVRLHDLARIGAVVDALVAAGANHIDGVSFALADSQPAEDQARGLAVKALKAKADLYAAAMGYHVARLVRLSENGGYSPSSVSEVTVMAARFRRTPVQAGELTVTVGVNAEFELAR